MKNISSHKIICWQLSVHCNRQCSFCISQSSPLLNHPDRNIDEALHRLSYLGVEKLSYSGGEPFLYPKIDYLISKATDLGFIQTITTNGDSISEIPISMIEQLEYIKISFYGDRILHNKIMGANHYEKILASSTKLKEQGIRVGANYLLTNKSEKTLQEFLEDGSGIFDNILINSMMPNGKERISKNKNNGLQKRLLILAGKLSIYTQNYINGIKIHNNQQPDYYVILDHDDTFFMNQSYAFHKHILGNIYDSELLLPGGELFDSGEVLSSIWRKRASTSSVIPLTKYLNRA